MSQRKIAWLLLMGLICSWIGCRGFGGDGFATRGVRRGSSRFVSVITLCGFREYLGLGYSLGSLVGLHLAALDQRLAGLVSVCGAPPFRLGTATSGSGGILRWSHLYPLVARLGFFVGHEDQMAYDVHHLYACIAPRPLLVVGPELDWHAPAAEVTMAVNAARRVYALYGAADRLAQLVPEDYNHFGPKMQDLSIKWL